MKALKKARILVCDDDANMRDSILDNLEDDGYEVLPAATGREAVDAVGQQFFDVILMDYQLTDSTGIEVIKKIRAVNTESKVLMLTGHGSVDLAKQSFKEEIYRFLTKPVDFAELKDAIGKALDKLRLERENKRLIADLKKANTELSSLSQMKSKFLSMSSHDLSNALMTLQVSFEMLSSTLTPNDEQKKRMAYISSGINQIKRLIEDLVDWASIEQGRFRLEKDWFSPAALVEEIVIGPQGRAAARGISLSCKVGQNLPMIWADRRRICQIINNLLENAIRHTLRGGGVTLSVELPAKGAAEAGGRGSRAEPAWGAPRPSGDESAARGSEVVFAVSDTGEGISPEEHEKIFLSFCQGSGQQERGRLGLGLSISREIAESHGGRIWVESPGLGKGATFSFTVPLKEPS
ncbi:MAG: response regulator [Elusimicrobia bacterium]|nr:response regulator [Elusimicrobiota bacterium]